MTVIAIKGDFPLINNRILRSKVNKRNRLLVTYEVYLNLPDHIRNTCKVGVYKTNKNENVSSCDFMFHEIDFHFESDEIDNTFILGNELIENMLKNNKIDKIELYDRIPSCYLDILHLLEGFEPDEEFVSEENILFKSWSREFHPENNYLELLQKVLTKGTPRQTRNAETISLFGESIEFDLKYGFPLLTTKKMFFTGIVKELLWFLNGKTNVNELKADGVHIWDGNTTREFLDGIGLQHYPEGCAGPIYGYQWRNFNAPYDVETMMPKESGFDQLMFCIKELQTNPTSRRMVMSGWNPCQMSQMCLPPCHVLYQFYVEGDRLSCQLYQRSADLFLGLPFNIASTALMTTLIACLTGYKPGKIRICIGDAHIYKSHVDNVITQIKRIPLRFCTIHVDHFVSDPEAQIREWKPEHIFLDGYKSHGKLTSPMIA
jgi:dihydrofolate reductase/thymidylate synthase